MPIHITNMSWYDLIPLGLGPRCIRIESPSNLLNLVKKPFIMGLSRFILGLGQVAMGLNWLGLEPGQSGFKKETHSTRTQPIFKTTDYYLIFFIWKWNHPETANTLIYFAANTLNFRPTKTELNTAMIEILTIVDPCHTQHIAYTSVTYLKTICMMFFNRTEDPFH